MKEINMAKEEDIRNLEENLQERYEHLIQVLTNGEREVIDLPFQNLIKIDKRELRLAIDDFNTILKEIKRLCR